MESVHIETTIISYLVARPSRDPILAAHQSVTRNWWTTERHKYRCVVSEEVVREASDGEPLFARLRLESISGLIILPVEATALQLVDTFMATGALPPTMRNDAIHLAVAVTAKVDYLLTWNCKHIANSHILRRLSREASRRGMILPVVSTPLGLMEGE